MKRAVDGESEVVKKLLGLDAKIAQWYDGYSPDSKETPIDVVTLPKTPEEVRAFFVKYVVGRRPCKIVGVMQDGFDFSQLRPENISKTLPVKEYLQIEKKADGGFGSGAKRIKMPLGDFLEKILAKGETDLYLTTQYFEDDPFRDENLSSSDDSTVWEWDNDVESAASTSSVDLSALDGGVDDYEALLEDTAKHVDLLTAEEDEVRINELYQPPMANLATKLREKPHFMDYMIPQQINLWIGATKNNDFDFKAHFNEEEAKLGFGRNIPTQGASSSGLHHDHADNLYIPISGHKRFTLFSPKDAAKMYTVGDIRQVYPTGVIDYVRNDRAPSWRQLRDDSAIVAEVYKELLKNDKNLTVEQRKEYELFVETDSSISSPLYKNSSDPPSFSRIPAALVHVDEIQDEDLKANIMKIIRKRWPLFLEANRITVDLKSGEMLYLPTGWFHEVTSFGETQHAANVHVAVNYWFITPNGTNIENAYIHTDNYWPTDYKRTQQALQRVRNSSQTV